VEYSIDAGYGGALMPTISCIEAGGVPQWSDSTRSGTCNKGECDADDSSMISVTHVCLRLIEAQ